MAYYPPCHLREQKVRELWWELLGLLPEASLQKVGDCFQCCGIGGIMGFKQEFYEASIALGNRLMEEIRAVHPERLLTDCLSCRIQFNQLLPYQVFHPVEVLEESYNAYTGFTAQSPRRTSTNASKHTDARCPFSSIGSEICC